MTSMEIPGFEAYTFTSRGVVTHRGVLGLVFEVQQIQGAEEASFLLQNSEDAWEVVTREWLYEQLDQQTET